MATRALRLLASAAAVTLLTVTVPASAADIGQPTPPPYATWYSSATARTARSASSTAAPSTTSAASTSSPTCSNGSTRWT